MNTADFTIRVIAQNPHREGTMAWRAGRLVTAMEGCSVPSIVEALTALGRDTRPVGRDTRPAGVGDPARWLTHFAGLESPESGKHIEPWIEIVHGGQPLGSRPSFRGLL
jgi:hypothetical protein